MYKKNARENYPFSDKRIQRGLYRHYDDTITTADINGATNILRKVLRKLRIISIPKKNDNFRHEDPDAAERNARIDDYLNNWF